MSDSTPGIMDLSDKGPDCREWQALERYVQEYFFYRCAFHGVADDVFQDQGIVPFPEEGIALQEPFPSGVPLQEPVNPFPDIAVRWLCAVPFQCIPPV